MKKGMKEISGLVIIFALLVLMNGVHAENDHDTIQSVRGGEGLQ
jgi:hypothetical protein